MNNLQAFNEDDIGFSGFPNFFAGDSSSRQAVEEKSYDPYRRSSVDERFSVARKPYQPALTFLSQENFGEEDMKFKHRFR